jgi:hypothetical protein
VVLRILEVTDGAGVDRIVEVDFGANFVTVAMKWTRPYADRL